MTRATITMHAGFCVGQRVYLKEATTGGTFVEVGGEEREDEITYPIGSPGLIDRIEDFGGDQGIAFTVTIGEITNVFDEGDGPIGDFLSAEPLPVEMVHAVIEIVDGNEGNPGIHLHRTKAGASATAARLREENEGSDDVLIVETEVGVTE